MAKNDPDSIFPWHHITPTPVQQEEQQHLDLSSHFDPWSLYVGDIPLKKEFYQSTGSEIPGRVEITQEMKDYIWDYKRQQNTATTSNTQGAPHQYLWEQAGPNYEQNYEHSNYSDHQLPLLQHQSFHSHHQHGQYGHSNKSNSGHQHGRQLHHRDESQQHHLYHHKHDKYRHNDPQYHDHHHHNHQHHRDCHQDSNQNHDHHLGDHHFDSHQHEKESTNAGSTWNTEKQVKTLNDHPLHRYDIHTPQSHGDHHQQHVLHVRKHVPKKVHKAAKKRAKRLHRIDLSNQNTVTNGDLSGEDGEDLEIVQPRHPYDSFYLRHRSTVDARGRRICTHQIPPTPPPTPPPESPEPSLTDQEEVDEDLVDSQVSASRRYFKKRYVTTVTFKM